MLSNYRFCTAVRISFWCLFRKRIDIIFMLIPLSEVSIELIKWPSYFLPLQFVNILIWWNIYSVLSYRSLLTLYWYEHYCQEIIFWIYVMILQFYVKKKRDKLTIIDFTSYQARRTLIFSVSNIFYVISLYWLIVFI